MTKSKLEILRKLMSTGDWDEAINLAATFPTLGKQKARIQKVRAARENLDFYREIGFDPIAGRADAISALKERFGDPQNNFRDGEI